MKSKFTRSVFIAASATLLAAAGAVTLAVRPAYADTTTQESAGGMIDDTVLTTKVKSAFVEDEKVSALRINVTTNKGIVQLSGFANSAQEANRAVELARQIPGVKDVKNDIELKQSQTPKSQY
jgi:osmotically-inducible protein OsmY